MSVFYVAVDGDDSGKKLAADIAHNYNERYLAETVGQIATAMTDIADFVREGDGAVHFNGGDNLAFSVASDANLDDVMAFVDGVRGIYFEHTAQTASAGVGLSIKDACDALLVAKRTGKDKSVFWNESAAAIYDTIDLTPASVAQPKHVRLAREDQIQRLVAKGYTQSRAQFIADRNFVYGRSSQLPGNTDVERFLIEGENQWRAFIASNEPSNTTKDLVIGQKVLFLDEESANVTLAVVRSIDRTGMSVETINGHTRRIASGTEYRAIPMIRGANDA